MRIDPQTLPPEPSRVFELAYGSGLAEGMTRDEAEDFAWEKVEMKWSQVNGEWVEHALQY